jgi:hypothetical protein
MNLQAANASGKPDKRKMALIPILVGVLIWNLSGSGDDRSSVGVDTPESSEQKLTEAESLIRQLQGNRQNVSQKNWPAFELGDIVDFDPFSLTGTLAERSGIIPEAELAAQSATANGASGIATPKPIEPGANPVRAVTIGRNGAAALVDSRIVRVGDELEAGIRVVAIERNAIVVEMVD